VSPRAAESRHSPSGGTGYGAFSVLQLTNSTFFILFTTMAIKGFHQADEREPGTFIFINFTNFMTLQTL
jgi:hypothetical protein